MAGETLGDRAGNSTSILLPDGTAIPIRPIQPDDAPALQRFHRRLSEGSIYLRHFGAVPELSDERARYFTRLETPDRFALVALDPEQPVEIVAVVRFDREPGTDRAEYAALVEDRWQGRGIGRALTERLVETARERGVRCLYALVLPENRRMIRILRGLGWPSDTVWSDGTLRVDVNLSGKWHEPA